MGAAAAVRYSWRRNLAIIWISQFLSMASFSSAYTFMPFYFSSLGVPDDELSMYVALFNVAGNLTFCIFAPIWGMVADVYGRRMMLLRANFGAAVMLPLMALMNSPEWLILLRLGIGALTGTVAAAQTLLISTTPKEHRSFALGTIASALFGGMMAGQFLGGDYVMLFGFHSAFLASGGLLFVSGLLVLLGVRENFERRESMREHLAGIRWRLPRFGLVWYLLILFVFMGLAREFDNPFLPILVREVMHGAPEAVSWSGRISGFCSLAGILSGLLLGYLADRMSLIRVASAVIVIAGAMRIVQSFSSDVIQLLVERSLMVLAAGGIEPLLQSWLAGVTPEREHGSFFGWAACFKSVGWMLGALSGGFTASLLGGVRGVFFGSGIMFLLLVPLMLFTSRRLPPPRFRRTGR